MSIKRNMDGLRKHLFEQLELLRSNKISLSQARETRRTAATILESVYVELKFNNMIIDQKDNDGLIKIGNLKLVK